MRLHSVSLYNVDADVLFLSEGALGPDEHNVVIEAMEAQKADKSQSYYEYGMEDGRMAVFLPIRGPRNDLAGTVMILADMKAFNEGTMERIVTPQIRTILVKIAMFMRKNAPASAADAVPEVAATPVNLNSTTVIEKLPAQLGATLGPREVDQMLELELVAEPPRAPVVPSVAMSAAAANGAASGKNSAGPGKKSAAASATTPPASKAAARVGAAPAARGAPTLTSVPSMPPRDIEVLAFETDFAIPAARPAAAPPADIEVLAFDVEPPVVSAAPVAPAPAPPVGSASPPTAKPAPTASTSSVRAINVGPAPSGATSSVRVINAAATSAAAAAATFASATGSALAAKAAPANGFADSPTSYAARSAASASTAQTAAVQIISVSDEESALINDTGPVPQLLDTTSIEPAPQLPPLEPLTIEESAADLTLFAQELIKLRSSGRTRRYEVLARSQRDVNRNEVPAAFVAESARGKDGAALDAMVVERLLTWLGKHGEAIWDSEPASFSVNLSIGAIEDESFPQRIEQWLEQHSVPAEYIGFEITEFACVQCRPAVQRFVDAIEKMGCFLVIDNFSFDSSVFEMLGSKALRHVKLDPKVTTAAMKDKLPQALVVAILQACKVLGVHCVAKRVESQSSMQWLTAVGCDFAQSFSLHKPLPLDSLASGQPIKALRE